jgi:hypothetical protein
MNTKEEEGEKTNTEITAAQNVCRNLAIHVWKFTYGNVIHE